VDPHIDPLEAETLKRICGLTPGTFRLACKLRIFGPVTLRLIKESKT